MPRPQKRAKLENGLKLDLNSLIRQTNVQPGEVAIGQIDWNCGNSRIGCSEFEIDLRETPGIFRIAGTNLANCAHSKNCAQIPTQEIVLMAHPRNLGGVQWYFICQWTLQLASVLWLPVGATQFASRHKWAGRVAYNSQFLTADARAIAGQDKIKKRICRIGGFDPEEWDFPPKPDGMSQIAYERAEHKFQQYERRRDEELAKTMQGLIARFGDMDGMFSEFSNGGADS